MCDGVQRNLFTYRHYGEFVERLRQESDIGPILPPRVSLQEIDKIICELFEVAPGSIYRRTKGGVVAEARAVFCYTAIRLLGRKGIEVGRFLSMGHQR